MTTIWLLTVLVFGKQSEEVRWAFETEQSCIDYAQTTYDVGVDRNDYFCRRVFLRALANSSAS